MGSDKTTLSGGYMAISCPFKFNRANNPNHVVEVYLVDAVGCFCVRLVET